MLGSSKVISIKISTIQYPYGLFITGEGCAVHTDQFMGESPLSFRCNVGVETGVSRGPALSHDGNYARDDFGLKGG